MKKVLIRLILLSLFAATFISLHAQESGKLRVAVFDPSSSGATIDEDTKVAVRELISSIFVNTGKYSIVERSLLEKVMKEQEFSNSGAVDDSQATEVGKLAGANKAVLSIVTLVGGRNMLSVKIIDVQTATIDQQKTIIVNTKDLLDAVEPLTMELLGEKVPDKTPDTQVDNTLRTKIDDEPAAVETKIDDKPATVSSKPIIYNENALVAKGSKVFVWGQKLSKDEVISLMINTDAIRFYDKGISRRRTGNILLLAGIGLGTALIMYGNMIDDKMFGQSIGYKELSYAGLGLGIAAITVGITFKIKGKKQIKKSVDMYNSQQYSHKRDAELHFGIVGNGIGFAYKF
jgi:hypothetical protein